MKTQYLTTGACPTRPSFLPPRPRPSAPPPRPTGAQRPDSLLPKPRAPEPTPSHRSPDSAAWTVVRVLRERVETLRSIVALEAKLGASPALTAAQERLTEMETRLVLASSQARRVAGGAR